MTYETCRVLGKLMYVTKQEARESAAAKFGFTQKHVRWSVTRCIFCDHYHWSKLRGSRRGKSDLQKVTRGKR
jgi:hypothetical protein